jgi:hypothetical protein
VSRFFPLPLLHAYPTLFLVKDVFSLALARALCMLVCVRAGTVPDLRRSRSDFDTSRVGILQGHPLTACSLWEMNLFPLTAAHAAIQLQRVKLAICVLVSPAPSAALHCIVSAKEPSPSSSQGGACYLSSFDPPHAFDKDGLSEFD